MPDPSIPIKVLSFEDARRAVEQQAGLIRPPGTESLDLLSAAGRILAEPIEADRDFPPFPRATRDGYAVRSADLAHVPMTLNVIAEIKAGEKAENFPANIAAGQTASIMTGAPLPDGADAVVMVEYSTEHGNRVEISRS